MQRRELEYLHTDLLKEFPYKYDTQTDLLVIDLTTIMGAIYCKDVSTTARKSGLNLTIPVFLPEKWSRVSKLINDLVKWVSGENFNIAFTSNTITLPKNNLELDLSSKRPVTLFSGGLDSLTGAYRNFSLNIKSDYLGFINKNEEKTYQVDLRKFYFEYFKSDTEITLIDKPINKKKHLTQSTRSLLYFALAVSKAYYNNSDTVFLYENGILSLNPTINNRFTTKTTHPKTIYDFNSILDMMELNIHIQHPFIFNTKGEQINQMNEDFKQVICKTITCGSGRSNKFKNHTGQCGVCIPCILRKISMAGYDNEKYDSKYYLDYELKFKDLTETIYRTEYIQNIEYFKNYCDLIKNERTMFETKIKPCYYNDTDYGEKNKIMFNKFANEFERFIKKYAPD